MPESIMLFRAILIWNFHSDLIIGSHYWTFMFSFSLVYFFVGSTPRIVDTLIDMFNLHRACALSPFFSQINGLNGQTSQRYNLYVWDFLIRFTKKTGANQLYPFFTSYGWILSSIDCQWSRVVVVILILADLTPFDAVAYCSLVQAFGEAIFRHVKFTKCRRPLKIWVDATFNSFSQSR